MNLRSQFLRHKFFFLLFLLLQIVFVLWLFFGKSDPYGSSVLLRLRSEKDGRTEDGVLSLPADASYEIFTWYEGEACITEGHYSFDSKEGRCLCKRGWKGKRCGIPRRLLDRNWMKDPILVTALSVKKKQRRIIYILNDFFYDFEMLELNLKYIGDLVDVFVISEDESLYIHSQESLLSRLKQNYIQSFHDKLLYIDLGDSNAISTTDKLHHTVDRGLQLLSGVHPDDILLFASPEHVFSRKFLIFLKVFHNYALPIQCSFKEYVYGFHYTSPQNKVTNSTEVHNVTNSAAESVNCSKGGQSSCQDIVTNVCVITVRAFSIIYEAKVSELNDLHLLKRETNVNFFNQIEQPLTPWFFPKPGFSCHLCATNRQIHFKLMRLPMVQKPAWFYHGDESSNIEYIQAVKAKGRDEYERQCVEGHFSMFKDISEVMHYDDVIKMFLEGEL